MPLTDEQQNDIIEHLRETAEAEGVNLGTENFTRFLFAEWDNVINPAKMDRKALRRELQDLREQKKANRAANTAIDTRIAEIQALLE